MFVMVFLQHFAYGSMQVMMDHAQITAGYAMVKMIVPEEMMKRIVNHPQVCMLYYTNAGIQVLS